MERVSLDTYDILPEDMLLYLQHNGWHFNKKMCEFAVSLMRKDGSPLMFHTKEKIDTILKQYNVTVNKKVLYDHVYIFHMGKADFFGKSIVDEYHLALYVKDVIDDEDACDGMVFNRWYADMCKKGIPIDWDEML